MPKEVFAHKKTEFDVKEEVDEEPTYCYGDLRTRLHASIKSSLKKFRKREEEVKEQDEGKGEDERKGRWVRRMIA